MRSQGIQSASGLLNAAHFIAQRENSAANGGGDRMLPWCDGVLVLSKNHYSITPLLNAEAARKVTHSFPLTGGASGANILTRFRAV